MMMMHAVVTTVVRTLLINPADLLLRWLHTAFPSGGSQGHEVVMSTLTSLYNDCLQWMLQCDGSTALSIAWMLSPIILWFHHIRSMSAIDTSYNLIASIIEEGQTSSSLILPSNPTNHNEDSSSIPPSSSTSQPVSSPFRSASQLDHRPTHASASPPTGSITDSPNMLAGIEFNHIGASIDGRSALKVLLTTNTMMMIIIMMMQ